MTCIGASGPLIDEVSRAVREGVTVVSVLSGNRNFEGRIQPEVAMNYLASPPLVIAYALAGTMDIDLATEPLGNASDGRPIFLADLWPDAAEVHEVIAGCLSADMFADVYRNVFAGDHHWRNIDVAKSGCSLLWDDDSTYIRRPPYLDGVSLKPSGIADIAGARILVKLGDLITTDHISPAGAITSGTARVGLSGGPWCDSTRHERLRVAQGQPRGDDARSVRQCATSRTTSHQALAAVSPATSLTVAVRQRFSMPPPRTGQAKVPMVVVAGAGLRGWVVT